jgi:hypothetical protein
MGLGQALSSFDVAPAATPSSLTSPPKQETTTEITLFPDSEASDIQTTHPMNDRSH